MKERLKQVPLRPGVYLFKDKDQQVIYVGKAKALRNRLRSYFQNPSNLDPKVRALMNRVNDFDFIVTANELEALILENNLIKSYQPRYNIMLRDDKTYPYIKIGVKEKYPRLYITREEKDGVSRYFGPYTDVTSLKETVKLLNTIFPLRTCKGFKKRSRPCLNWDLHLCLAPCIADSPDKEEEYRQAVAGLIAFFEGQTAELLQVKAREMKQAAMDLDFEKAARLRDQIKHIKQLSAKQQMEVENSYNLDVIGLKTGEKDSLILLFTVRGGKIVAKDTFWLNAPMAESPAEVLSFFIRQHYTKGSQLPPEILIQELPEETPVLAALLAELSGGKVAIRQPQRGTKRRLLEMALDNVTLLWQDKMEEQKRGRERLFGLAQKLNLDVIPEHIECYDISHLAGQETVASMVVFTQGEPDNNRYRRFKLEHNQNDDFASLQEVLTRRFHQAREGNPAFLPEPDLILIDGGLGQVNAVDKVLRDLKVDIPLISLAKKNEEIYWPHNSEPLLLSRRDEVLQLLQRIRDEAHRFAIEYNRKRRRNQVKISALDNIEGIGAIRKKALLSHFGSVARVKSATLEELQRVSGINNAIAAKIFDYFHGDVE